MKRSLIYVEDEPEVASIFQHIVEGFGHSVRLAASASEALSLIKKQQPDLILIDYHLRGETGLDLAAQLDPLLPKVFVTGDHQCQMEGQQAQVFYKPIDFRELEKFLLQTFSRS